MSSIFISYTTRDVEGDVWADQLVAWCEEWQYGYFRDKDRCRGVVAGDNWRASLHQQLGLAQVVISLCSPSYESSSWCVWELAAAVERGKRVIPVQLGGKQVPNLVQNRQVLVIEQAVNPSENLLEEVKHRLHRALMEQLDWRALQPWDRSLPPYPGLPAFEAEQAPVFFGRDAAVDTVRERLASLAQRSPAFLLLLGASGTGKSSLVRAGVLPRLQADGGRWQLLAPFTPGPMPFLRLAKVLMEAWASFEQLPPSKELGERDEDTLLRQLQYLHAIANAPVLLVVDQFEELLVEQQPEAERFLQFLQELLQLELCGVVLLATLRSDFLELLQSRWPNLVGLSTALPIQPIQPEDFGALILGPAQRSGLTLQPGLQERIVKDSGGRDALPLLAFTLEKLWQKRQDRGKPVEGPNGALYDITLEDYQALNGVVGAVRSQAALCWNPQTTTEADTAALRDAFLFHLVRLNEEGVATKQAARWVDLPVRSRPLLRRFVKARLVVSGDEIDGGVLEIAHEALLRTWEPLRRWIETGRQQLEQRRRVKRLCVDLSMDHPLQARLAALQGLLPLAESDPETARPAVEALAGVLQDVKREPQEWLAAIRLLGLLGGGASVRGLSGFLEQRQLQEPTPNERAVLKLEALCQAAAALQDLHRQLHPGNDQDERWLLLPSARVTDDGRSLCTQLVKLRLWATPRLEEPGAWFEPLGEGVALTMVAIPAGSFLMGSPLEEQGRKNIEGPQRLVNVGGFWMGQTAITQAQWLKVMENNHSQFQGNQTDQERPVEQVSWNDAMSFCRKLKERTGRHYTLPTEIQWEYACRAGTTTPFSHGYVLLPQLANYGAGRAGAAFRRETFAVNRFPANTWGLHAVHGDVEEWCLGPWRSRIDQLLGDEDYINEPIETEADGIEERTPVRGGCFFSDASGCRSASRNYYNSPDAANYGLGFRVIIDHVETRHV